MKMFLNCARLSHHNLNCDCVDINECVNSSAHNCSEEYNERCRNTEGSYGCDCIAGFERKEGNCRGNRLIIKFYSD